MKYYRTTLAVFDELTRLQVLMEKDGAYKEVYSSVVLRRFDNMVKTEEFTRFWGEMSDQMNLFVPNTLFLFYGHAVTKIKGLFLEREKYRDKLIV